LAGSAATPDGQLHAQSFSSSVRLPAGRAALVRTLLNSVSARRRAEAAEELGLTGDPRVLEALATAAAHDTEPSVRRAARQAIRQIRGDQEEPPQWPGPIPVPTPRDPNVILVQSWYQRFLGRSADAAGLASHVAALRRGMAAEDVQAAMLASDEFWQNAGGTASDWIVGLYRAVLSRGANRYEIGIWGRRFNALRGDRGALAREFVREAQGELLRQQGFNPNFPF
jgi:HEAT repeat protein